MRAGIYVRVSTQRQAQADGIAQQLERLQAWARQEGWTVAADDLFRDDGFSGATLRRPGLARMRDRAAARALDVVLVTAPDRLARNYVHQVLLLEELQGHGCEVRFLDRPMGQDPHDQLLLQIRGAVAEYERSLIAERMRRGRQRKLQAGLLLPWTKPPYGYRVDPERPRDPTGVRRDEAEAAVVAEMFAWSAEEGRSLYGLAQKLQRDAVPTPSGLRRWNLASLHVILTNPVYTGQVYSGRVRRRAGRAPTAPPGAVPASRVVLPREDWIAVASVPVVVDEETFERVQAKLSQNRAFAARNNTAHPYLLRGLVSCGECGLACAGRHLRPGYRYYCCRGKLPAVHSCRDTKCLARYAPAEALEAVVWDDLCRLLTEPRAIRWALERAHGGHWLPQELQARREVLRRGAATLRQALERLTAAYLDGVLGLAEYRRRRRELEERERALHRQAGQLAAQVDRRAEIARLAEGAEAFCARVRQGLAQATWEQKRQLIEDLIARVVVRDAEVEIRYVVPTKPGPSGTRACHLHPDYRTRLQAAQKPARARPVAGEERAARPQLVARPLHPRPADRGHRQDPPGPSPLGRRRRTDAPPHSGAPRRCCMTRSSAPCVAC
jgi:site-specific DNA recombinase